MKKQSLFQTLLFAVCVGASLVAPAQVNTGIHPSTGPGNQRPGGTSPSTVRTSPMSSSVNRVRESMKLVPRPDPIRFITWRNKLERPMAGRNASNVMDLTTTRPGTTTTAAHGTLRPGEQMNAVREMTNLATVTHRTTDGHKTSYTLTTEINSWENKPNYAAAITPTSKPSDDGQWTCTTSNISVNARSTSFMNPHPDEGASMLIPGMIYAFDEYSSGNFNQHYNVGRNPVNLVTNVYHSSGPISATVNDPNLTTLSEGVRGIVSQYAPLQAGSDYQIQATLTDNTSDQDIFVSAGGSYGAFAGSASFKHSQNEHHIYFTIDAVKPMYTVNVQPAGNGLYPAGIPNSSSPLLMMQSVTFGARVLANMDIELKSTSDLGNLHLSYNDGMESARTDMEALFANNTVNITINGYLIGFPTQFPGSFTATKDNFFHLMDQFFSGCNYQTAKPIQYSMVNMQGNQVGIYSATDNFSIQECSPSNETFTLQSVFAVIQTGDDDKNNNSEFWLTIGAGDPQHIRWVGQIYDNHSEFKRDGNPWQIPIPVNGSYTENDFNNGGLVALKLIEHGHSGDDWDFQDLKLIFNFQSQKGTPHTRTLDVANFKLHDTKDSQRDSKQIFFQVGGDNSTYAPVQ